MAVAASLKDWSTTEGSNSPAGSDSIGTGLDDNLRQIQATVRDVYSRTTVASAATCDIGAVDHGSMNISGTTQIDGFGTVSAGIRKWLTFEGALVLNYNATSMILPSAADITTAAGDVACFESLGSGNWKCLSYIRATGLPVVTQTAFTSGTFGDGSEAAPSIAFTAQTGTGFYRSGSAEISYSLNGTRFGVIGTANAVLAGTGTFQLSYGGTYQFGAALSLATTTGTISLSTANQQLNTGAFALTTGNSTLGGTAGSISLTAGHGTATASGVGGDVSLIAGAGHATTGTNTGGDVTITAGDGTKGGDVTITTGNGTGAGQDGGDLILAIGDGQVTTGMVKINNRDGAGDAFRIDPRGTINVVQQSVNPTITAGGGTSPTIVGTNTAFRVALGTTPGTTVTVQFTAGFTNAPIVVCSYHGSAINVRASAISASEVTFTFASTPTAGAFLDVHCFGYETS